MSQHSSSRPSLSERERHAALLALLRTDQYKITNALHVYARGMNDAAVEAQTAYDAGQADSEVKAAQDRTIMPNNGLLQAVLRFRQNADDATRIAGEIDRLIDGEDDGE